MTRFTTAHHPAQPSTGHAALSILEDGGPLPKMIVFDLDYTLWPFWVDTHVTPPIRARPSSRSPSLEPQPSAPTASTMASLPTGASQPRASSVVDRTSAAYTFYPDIAIVLSRLAEREITIAAASRTQDPPLAREMLRLLHISKPSSSSSPSSSPTPAISFFSHLEIYPGSKKRHFHALAKASGIRHEDMLFFDDESRNAEVEELGVTMCLVRDGVSGGEVERGVKKWRTRRDGGGGGVKKKKGP